MVLGLIIAAAILHEDGSNIQSIQGMMRALLPPEQRERARCRGRFMR